MYIYTYIYTHTHTHACATLVCVYACVCVYICIYIYTHTHPYTHTSVCIYMYIYTYIYTHTHARVRVRVCVFNNYSRNLLYNNTPRPLPARMWPRDCSYEYVHINHISLALFHKNSGVLASSWMPLPKWGFSRVGVVRRLLIASLIASTKPNRTTDSYFTPRLDRHTTHMNPH